MWAIVEQERYLERIAHCHRNETIDVRGPTQSTLAVELSKQLGVPYLSLDEVYWNPGWVATPNEDFKTRVKTFLDSHPDGWIIDGNYLGKIGPVVQDAATDVLCEAFS